MAFRRKEARKKEKRAVMAEKKKIEDARRDRFAELRRTEEKRRRRRLKFLIGQSKLFRHFMDKAGWLDGDEEEKSSGDKMQSPSRRRVSLSQDAKDKQDQEDLIDGKRQTVHRDEILV